MKLCLMLYLEGSNYLMRIDDDTFMCSHYEVSWAWLGYFSYRSQILDYQGMFASNYFAPVIP